MDRAARFLDRELVVAASANSVGNGFDEMKTGI